MSTYVLSSYYTKDLEEEVLTLYVEDTETIPTSPSLMEAATIFFKTQRAGCYRGFLPPTILLK